MKTVVRTCLPSPNYIPNYVEKLGFYTHISTTGKLIYGDQLANDERDLPISLSLYALFWKERMSDLWMN
jgi:hypothetical protein